MFLPQSLTDEWSWWQCQKNLLSRTRGRRDADSTDFSRIPGCPALSEAAQETLGNCTNCSVCGYRPAPELAPRVCTMLELGMALQDWITPALRHNSSDFNTSQR